MLSIGLIGIVSVTIIDSTGVRMVSGLVMIVILLLLMLMRVGVIAC